MEELTAISLFSGIGGDALAAQWAGFKTLCFVEWDKFCQKILKKHWPGIPIWSDIDGFTAKKYRGTVTIVHGGDPCQPNSLAGKRRGKEDNRYKWPAMLRVIHECQPNWVVSENPTGRLTMDFYQVLSDLESQGYETRSFIIPACAINAPHRRDRLYIVAYHNRLRCGRWPDKDRCSSCKGNEIKPQDKTFTDSLECIRFTRSAQPSEREIEGYNQDVANAEGMGWGNGQAENEGQADREIYTSTNHNQLIAYSNCQGLEKREEQNLLGQSPTIKRDNRTNTNSHHTKAPRQRENGGTILRDSEPARLDSNNWEASWLEVATALCGMDDGLPDRVARLRALGNAQVPQQIYPIFKGIADIENQINTAN